MAPDIPTVAEMGLPTLSHSAWYGLFAPKGHCKGHIMKLNAAAVETLADADVRFRLTDLGQEVSSANSRFTGTGADSH